MTPSSRPGSPTSPCRHANQSLAFLVLLLFGSAVPARGAVHFEVGGAVQPKEGMLDVRVEVRNAGDQPVPSLTVVGELFGRREEARVAHEVPPGGRVSVVLHFPDVVPRPVGLS